MLPWTRDEVTQATSPLKVYEFVAMGLPVVAPELDPLEGIPGVTVVQGIQPFVDAVERVGRASLSGEERTAMRRFSEANSWARRIREMGSLVGAVRSGAADHIHEDASPSRGSVAPVAGRGTERSSPW